MLNIVNTGLAFEAVKTADKAQIDGLKFHSPVMVTASYGVLHVNEKVSAIHV